MPNTSGVLYIVSTPIGNLADMTFRAVDTLKSVDLIAAEDTRHSRRLLDNYGITTRTVSLHQHNESQRILSFKKYLDEGQDIALISDAGTPLISDPGYRLVSSLREDNYHILTIPGPSAVIAGLSISGLSTDQFYFEGFLSSKPATRRQRLQKIAQLTSTTVVYEAPHRLKSLVNDICAVISPTRRICVARELTKKFETVKLAEASAIALWLEEEPNQQKGECVLMIEASPKPDKSETIDEEALQLLLSIAEYMPPKKAAGIVSQSTGVSKKVLYDALLALK